MLWIVALAGLLAFQPDMTAIRKLFEDALVRCQHDYGEADARTAQAARDLGLFLYRSGDQVTARRAIANAVRLDEKAFGANAPQTLEDAATLASISPPVDAEPLLRRAAESPDPMVAGPALTSLAAIRKQTGDTAAAVGLLRRAVEKADAVDRDGPTVALILNLLAQVVPAKEAAAILERALAIDQAKLGPRDPQTLEVARKLAALQRAPGQKNP